MTLPFHVIEITKKTAKITNRDIFGIFKPKTNMANAKNTNLRIFFLFSLLVIINTLTLLILLIYQQIPCPSK